MQHEHRVLVPRIDAGRGVVSVIRHTGLLPGLLAVALLSGTYALCALPPSIPLLLLAFSAVFIVYQFDRALDFSPEDHFNQPERLAWLRTHPRYVLISSGCAAAVAIAALPYLRPGVLWAGFSIGVLSLLYVIPVLPAGRRLKPAGFFKPVLIAGAWAGGCVLLPVLQAGAALTPAVAALTTYRFLFVLPNAILSDYPDREGDRRAGLHTMASAWSPAALRGITASSLAFAIAGTLAAMLSFGAPRLLLVDLVGPVIMLAAASRLQDSRNYSLTLDAILAWPALTALAAWAPPLF